MSRRLLIVADVVGGVRTFTATLAGELAAGGDEVHLALIGPGQAEAAPALRRLPVASVELRPYALEWMADPWDDVERAADWIAERTAELGPDLLHLNTFTPVRDPTVPVLLTVHSCVLTWWRAVHGGDAPSEWGRYRALATAALGRADAVLTPTAALRAALGAVYGTDAGRARVVPNGTPVAPVRPGGRRERLVVGAGRLWDAAKNAAALRAAAPAIDGRVVLLGAGGELGPLPQAELLGWLRRAAVFAAPARYEPFGLAALEAACSGCALVLGDIPSLREVWGAAAAYVPPDDPEALAAAANRLLDDPERRMVAAGAAAARARRYTAGAMAAGYRVAYDALRPAAVAR